MSFCLACGSPVDGRFCPKCGAAAGVSAGAANAAAIPATNAGLTENAVGALCYLGGLITGIIFLVIPPYDRNPRIKFHAFQSILFNLVWMLGWFAMIPLSMLLPFGLSLMLRAFGLLLWGGGFALWLFLMWQAYQGRSFSLPVIGAIARQQAGK